jgi:CBS-domain-containing membrane protein
MDEFREFRPLPKMVVSRSDCYLLDAFNPPAVTFESPAIEVMTDLSRVPPATINAEDSLTEANHSMLVRGVRLLIVVNSDLQVEGLVTTTDTLGEKPVLIAQRFQLSRDEILVSDVMTPVRSVEAIAIEDVKRARVGHVVASLQADGRAHAIVVGKGADGNQHLMGIFSASQVARQLGVHLQTHEIARTFAEIEAIIAVT